MIFSMSEKYKTLDQWQWKAQTLIVSHIVSLRNILPKSKNISYIVIIDKYQVVVLQLIGTLYDTTARNFISVLQQ